MSPSPTGPGSSTRASTRAEREREAFAVRNPGSDVGSVTQARVASMTGSSPARKERAGSPSHDADYSQP